MSLLIRYLFIAIVALSFSAATAAAVVPASTQRQFHVPLSGVEIEASALFSEPGEFGAFPLRMRIKNGTDRELSWQVTVSSYRSGGWNESYSYHSNLAVPSGTTKEFTLFTVMLSDGADSPGYRQPQSVRVRVNGYGVSKNEHTFATPYRDYKLNRLPYVALGPEVALRSASVLASEFAKEAKAFPGVTIDLRILPEDWRMLTGTAAIWISEGEWRAITAAQRDAIASWMLVGGRLTIFSSQLTSLTKEDLQLPYLNSWEDGAGRYGLGGVEVVRWTGSEVAFPDALRLLSKPVSLPLDPGDQALAESWRLVDRVPAPELNSFLVATLLFAYAVIVGPLNLRFAARRGARQLLFITTPIIAVLSCAALFTLIVLRDGFGGWGERNLAVLVEGGSNRALVLQEQISRTGVLLDDRGLLGNDYLMVPLSLFNRTYRSDRQDYQIAGRTLIDGWLGNRSRQGQLAFGVVPTRARITHLPHSATVVSSIEAELKTLYLMDDQEQWWRATQVLPGRPAKLVRVPETEFLAWSQRTIERLVGPSISNQLAAMRGRREVFFADAASDGGFSIAAFDQFSWQIASTVFYGPL